MTASSLGNDSSIVDIITCSICIDILKEPRSLPCLHTFCSQCLEGFILGAVETFCCPRCRRKFNLSRNGVKDLPENFFLQTIIEMKRSGKFSRQSAAANSTNASNIPKFDGDVNSVKFCSIHPNDPIRLYCLECDMAVCVMCMFTQHHGHRSDEIVPISTSYREEFGSKISEIDQILARVTQFVSELNIVQVKINEDFKVEESSIKKRFTDSRKILENFEKEFLEEARRSRDAKTQVVKTNLSLLEQQKGLANYYRETLLEYKDNVPHYQVASDGKQLLKGADDLKHSSNDVLDAELNMPIRSKFFPASEPGIQKTAIGVFKPAGKIIMALGLDTGISQKMLQISLDKPDAVNIITTPAWIPPKSAACVVSNALYVVGIGRGRNELWKWSASRDRWRRYADMPTSRCNFVVGAVGDKIYLLGGTEYGAERSPLDSIVCYDINSNTWTGTGQLYHAVKAAATVTYKQCLYVFGGVDSSGERVDYVQVYDTATGDVSLDSNSMPRKECYMTAVLWRFKALLMSYSTCYIYDFDSCIWQERRRFKTDGVYFGLTLDDDTLYISLEDSQIHDSREEKIVWPVSYAVKSLSVNDVMSDNEEAAWKHHATLPIPGGITACSRNPLFL